jgi:hypothetical protein
VHSDFPNALYNAQAVHTRTSITSKDSDEAWSICATESCQETKGIVKLVNRKSEILLRTELIYQNTKHRPTQELLAKQHKADLLLHYGHPAHSTKKMGLVPNVSILSHSNNYFKRDNSVFFQPKQMKDVAGYKETHI